MDFLSAKQSLSADIEFQSTLPGRGATKPAIHGQQRPGISIRAPRKGSDGLVCLQSYHHRHFNPRSPGGERRVVGTIADGVSHFNPRSPGGERLDQPQHRRGQPLFQSTLPGRGATTALADDYRRLIFQSTLPGRGATVFANIGEQAIKFQSTLPGRGATAAAKTQYINL